MIVIGKLAQKRENYQPLAIGDISTVSDQEWAEHWRPHGSGWRDPRPDNPCYLERAYGGSDMSAIANVSPWKTNLELWADKTGLQKKFQKPKNNDPLVLGHIYETATAVKYGEIRRRDGVKDLTIYVEGKIIKPDGTWERNPDGSEVRNPISMQMFRDGRKNADGSFKYPWALANCDAFVVENGVQGGLEIKTTASYNHDTIAEWKAGIIPKYYLLQIVYYMAVTNVMFFDICCSWGQSFLDTAIIRFYRDYDLEDWLLSKVAEFDDYVEQGIEPDVSDADGELLNSFYFQLFGEAKKEAPMVELPEKFRPLVEQALKLDKEEEAVKKRLAEIQKQKAKTYSSFYAVMKDSSYAQCRMDDEHVAAIMLDTPMHRPKFDEDRLKTERPEMYKKFLVTSEKFDLTAFGKQESKLKAEYMLPAEPNEKKDPSFSTKIIERKAS